MLLLFFGGTVLEAIEVLDQPEGDGATVANNLECAASVRATIVAGEAHVMPAAAQCLDYRVEDQEGAHLCDVGHLEHGVAVAAQASDAAIRKRIADLLSKNLNNWVGSLERRGDPPAGAASVGSRAARGGRS